MKLNQLRDVVAVAERGSLRAAARHLGIAQPAITRSIREIEQELGVDLFERHAKGAVLTAMGEAFVRRAVAIQSEITRAREEIDQMQGMTTGHVSIALSTVPHFALLPKALTAFRTRYPETLLTITEGLLPTVEAGLLDGTLDFYVGPLTEHPIGKELLVEKLFDNRRLVFGRKGHPLLSAKSLADLVHARWITTTVTLDSRAELGPLFESHALPKPHVDLRAQSALSMIVAAANSDLLMMLPEQWLDFPAIHELLEAFTLEEVLPAPAMCIVRRGRLPLTPAAEYLSDMLRRASEHHVRARGR